MPEKPTLDSYFSDIPAPLSETATALRSLILEADSDFREVIKWGSPVYERNKSVIWIKAHKKHITFGFFRGAELDDPDGRLEGTGKSMRHLKIRSPQDADELNVRRLINAALELDR